MNRKLNFNAGPSALPLEVLQQLQDQMVDYQGEGLSIVENSHRGKSFDKLYHDTIDLVKELMNIPSGYSVFFLGGGATLQFGMIPMNFIPQGGSADYTRTGSWANGACDDAMKVRDVHVAFDGKSSGYSTLPDPAGITPSSGASYFYLCSNETIGGVQWKQWPETGSVPLIADMSSDILSRPVPVDKFSLIFAGVQKNLGPSGAALIIVKDEFLNTAADGLPSYLDYKKQASKEGLMNTPPVFPVWGVKLVLEWVKKHGGASGMEKRAEKKAAMIYDVMDRYDGFYSSPVDARYRSLMNIVFRLPDEDLEKLFLQNSAADGMIGLKGHRSVGGCRASIYNGVPEESVEALAGFMDEFARKHG